MTNETLPISLRRSHSAAVSAAGARALRSERPTRRHDTVGGWVHDAFGLLDHRTQSHAIGRDGAPAGRYLSVEHDDQVYLIPLDGKVVHLGRGLSADVRIDDPRISRHHAIVAQRGDGVRVLDDRSANGTFVNGRQVTSEYLADGDVLRLDRVVFRFLEIGPEPRPVLIRRLPLSALARRRIPARGPERGQRIPVAVI